MVLWKSFNLDWLLVKLQFIIIMPNFSQRLKLIQKLMSTATIKGMAIVMGTDILTKRLKGIAILDMGIAMQFPQTVVDEERAFRLALGKKVVDQTPQCKVK
jgi:hypothetical protein